MNNYTDAELDLLASLCAIQLSCLKDEGRSPSDPEVIEVMALMYKLGLTPSWDDPLCETEGATEV